MKPVCSIVIRAYNEGKHLGRLLTGISHQSVQPVQVILVDSGSTDDTLQVAKAFPVEIIHIQPEEFTFGRSLNLGISQAKAEFVVIASAHVYPVYPDWLEKLLEPFHRDRIGLTYGKQRGADTTRFSEHQVFRTWFPDQSPVIQKHPFCNNANAAIRRELWLKNPYDEKLSGLEDLAWARWVQEQGYDIAYVPEAEVVHVHNETWQGIFNRYRREAMAFKQIYPQEKFGKKDLVFLWVSNVLADFRVAAEQRKLRHYWLEIVKFRWMQFWGTYQGYRQGGSLTWELRQAFYYPRTSTANPQNSRRKTSPIPYHDLGKQPHDSQKTIGDQEP